MTALDQVALTLELPIVLRLATEQDLPKLEWYGQYTHFRNLFRRAFREQQQGRRLMVLADCNDFPIGHIFILFKSHNPDIADGGRRAYLYSLRVMEMFRRQGLGTRLILEAEALAQDRRFECVTISVAKDNPGARGLYERLGYQVFAEDAGRWSYVDHRGQIRHVHEPCWMLEKWI
jgi:ribosomal protein S18 acetylase RimI-like enzyme